MAYHQRLLETYRADALAGRPFVCATCPYCNGERDATVKHIHPSTKPADPWHFWQHILLDKYRKVQSPAATANTARRFPSTEAGASSEEKLFVVGPMVDQSELPFRMLCREYGANLAYTPMLHAKSFADGAQYRQHYFTTTPIDVVRSAVEAADAATPNEKGTPSPSPSSSGAQKLVDRPCIVQFCGHDADTILEAARFAVRGEYKDPRNETAIRDAPADPAGGNSKPFYYYCDAVDLNLGCPQGIAKRGHYGSFLMEDWDLIHTIIHTLHVELEVPVTAKIRVFDMDEDQATHPDVTPGPSSFGEKHYDEVLSQYYAQMIRDAGAQLLCIHGRTREMKGQLSGLANLGLIRAMRDALVLRGSHRPSIPVLSNGNVLDFQDVLDAIDATGSDGHMCAEPLLWDPALFTDPAHPVPSGRLPRGAAKATRLAGIHSALAYVRWLREYPVDLGFVKAHLFKMCFHSYELHTGFRDQVARLQTSARAITRHNGGDTVADATCDCHAQANGHEEDGQAPAAETDAVASDVDAIEAHLRELLAAEEACDVTGEQPKTAQAEKKAAKAAIVDVFEEEGDLCIDF